MNINIQVTKARDRVHDYVQIMSEDMITVNIVLVVDKITIQDQREKEATAK